MTKKIISLLLLSLATVPKNLAAMDFSQTKPESSSSFTSLGRYIDFNELFIPIARCLYKEKRDVQGILDALIDEKKIGELPLIIRSGNQIFIKDIFFPEKLAPCLKDFITQLLRDSLKGRHFRTFCEELLESLNMDKVCTLFGPQGSTIVQQSLAFEDYDFASLAGQVNLRKVPFFKEVLENFFDIESLTKLLMTIFNRERITRNDIIDCFNFKPLLLRQDCTPERLPILNDGLRGLLGILFDFMQNPQEASESLLLYIGTGYAAQRAQRVQQASEEEVIDDETLARRVQEEWNQEESK